MLCTGSMSIRGQAETRRKAHESVISALRQQGHLVRLSRRISTYQTGWLGWDLFRAMDEALLRGIRPKKV